MIIPNTKQDNGGWRKQRGLSYKVRNKAKKLQLVICWNIKFYIWNENIHAHFNAF